MTTTARRGARLLAAGAFALGVVACGAGSDNPKRPGASAAPAGTGGASSAAAGNSSTTGGAETGTGGTGTGGAPPPPTNLGNAEDYTTSCDAELCTADEECVTCQFGTCCARPCPGQPCPEGFTTYCDRLGGLVCVGG